MPDIEFGKARKTLRNALGMVPEDQKGDVISGDIYIRTSSASSERQKNSRYSFAASTMLHEIILHLISQRRTEDHMTRGEKQGQSQKDFTPLTEQQISDNIFNFGGGKQPSTVITTNQMDGILRKLRETLKTNECFPDLHQQNDSPVAPGRVLKDEDKSLQNRKSKA